MGKEEVCSKKVNLSAREYTRELQEFFENHHENHFDFV